MLTLENRGVVYDARIRPTAERVSCFTGLFRSRSGILICGFQNGEAKHSVNSSIRLCRSDDHGLTWQELPIRFPTTLSGVPGSLAGAEIVENSAGQWLLFSTWFDRSEPLRPLFDPVTEGILHSKQLKATSSDEGATWSDWEIVPTPGLTGTAMCGPPIAWNDGRVAFAFESFKDFDDPTPHRHAAWLVGSSDGGKTFDQLHLVAQDPEGKAYYWDQRLCAAKTGHDYVGLFWTHNLAEQRDLTVHAHWGSLDDATTTQPAGPLAAGSIASQTRTQPFDTHLPGQISAPWLLDDGRLLAFIVDRGRPGTMTLWVSSDRGQTWPASEKLVVYTHDEQAMLTQGASNIDFKQYWEDMGKWTFGHPAIQQVSDTHLVVVFYAGVPNCLSIHSARVRFQ